MISYPLFEVIPISLASEILSLGEKWTSKNLKKIDEEVELKNQKNDSREQTSGSSAHKIDILVRNKIN